MSTLHIVITEQCIHTSYIWCAKCSKM